MKNHRILLIVTLLINMTLSLKAEVFYLTDGSQIVGDRIESDSEDKIIIRNKFLGVISFDSNDVISNPESTESKSSPLSDTPTADVPTADIPSDSIATPDSILETTSTNGNSEDFVDDGKVSDLDQSGVRTPYWSGNFSIGFNYASPVAPSAGVGRQIRHKITGMLVRKTPDFAYSLYGAYDYVDIKPAGVQVDDWLLGADFRKDIDDKKFFYGQTNYIVDEVLGAKPQIETLAGIGFEVLNDKRSSLILVPGIAYTDINYTNPTSANRAFSEFGYAGYVEYSFLFTEKTAFKANVLFAESLQDLSNYYYKGTIGIETQLYKNISLQTGYNFNYNDALGLPYNKFTETLTTAINVKF